MTIRIGDYVRIHGFGPNEVVMRVVHKRPGAVWCQHSRYIVWNHKPRDVRRAKPAEVRRAIARGMEV